MLSRQNRLQKQKDFDRVYKQGRSISGPLFNLKWARNDLATSRLAAVISKKTEKLVTRRNLVRRRLRAALRPLWPQVSPGFDIVITVKRPAVGKNFSELTAEVEKIMVRAGLLKSNT